MPTFCYHSELSVYGACRMCMVENERGMLEASCSTPPRPGMSIKTNTEKLRKYRKMPLRDVIDLSENERLSRTLITGTTALIALVGALFMGGPVLFPLVFTMVFGILIGTYSSIYVALPLILLWGVKRGDLDEAEPIKPATAR